MRYIIVLKCQRRDQQRLGPVLHTSETETVHCRECKRRTREKEAAILGGYGCACRPWNCVLPLNSVGEGCSITSDALVPTRTGLRDVLTFEVVVSRPETVFHGRDPNFPRLLAKDSLEKRKIVDVKDIAACGPPFFRPR